MKPEFWQSEEMAALPPRTQLLAIGLLNFADDEGYFKAHPSLIRAAIFPFTEDSLNIHGMLSELSEADYLRLFQGDDGKNYGLITSFSKHQRVSHPKPSVIKPLDPFREPSVNDAGECVSGKEGKGKEGNKATASQFDEFWLAYPRKKNKGQAQKAWKKIAANLVPMILSDLRSRTWPPDPQYIPYPSTYLNAKGWEDEDTPTPTEEIL